MLALMVKASTRQLLLMVVWRILPLKTPTLEISVYLAWLSSEVTLKELYGPGGNNYFRITTNDGQSVVDLYDVEKLYFSDYVDEQDFKALTNGRVIGKDDWDLAYG